MSITNPERAELERAQRQAGIAMARDEGDPVDFPDHDRVSERPMPRTAAAARDELTKLNREISALNMHLSVRREEFERRGGTLDADAPLTEYEQWRRRALSAKIYREERAAVLKHYIRSREGLGEWRPGYALHQIGNLIETYETFINAFAAWHEIIAEPAEGANEQGDLEWSELQAAYADVERIVADIYGAVDGPD
ncbi:MAG TPA: hypothetical protein VFX03_13575 [Thermomicrobiales bacterium]|nr:hypothetical protein [Thermomicrobiales bacterium]